MGEEPSTYDLVVIGGGPAGINGATTARILGKTVALVDRYHELGGAGANTGTVPSKTLRETAVALSGFRSRDLYGVDLSLRREVTVGDFLRHERKVKSGLNAMLFQRLSACNADLFFGDASFEDPHTVRVRTIDSTRTADEYQRRTPVSEGEVLLRGEKILIAVGSSPVRPAVFPFGPGVHDSDSILALRNVPTTMAVIGAGTIGSEYACIFSTLGTTVHVIDGREGLLPFLDGEVSQALAKEMERLGIIFHWKERVESCERTDPESLDGSHSHPVVLKLSSGLSLAVDDVLVAAGRSSSTNSLNLEAAGVKTGDRGLVLVDGEYRTNVAHIYAAGDVIGFPALASTSMDQARRAVRTAFGLSNDTARGDLMPHGIWTIPEIGMVGETEESLKKKGIEYIAGRAGYADNARGRIIGATRGFLKLLFRLSDLELVGAHVIGEQATDIVHIGMMAMLARARADLFDELCFNLPTLGELYRFAAFDALRALGRLDEVAQADEFL